MASPPSSTPSRSSSGKKLERRLAKKISDYDSFPSRPRPRPRPSSSSLPSIGDSPTSFRVSGLHSGEFQLICEQIGISGGPDAFAISIAAWETGKLQNLDRNLFTRISAGGDQNPDSVSHLKSRAGRLGESRGRLYEDDSASHLDNRNGDLDRSPTSRMHKNLNYPTRNSKEADIVHFHFSSVAKQPSGELDRITNGSKHINLIECDTERDEVNDPSVGIHVIKKQDKSVDMKRVSKNLDASSQIMQGPLHPPPLMREKKPLSMMSTLELLESFGPDKHTDYGFNSRDIYSDDESTEGDSEDEEDKILLEESQERVSEIEVIKHQDVFVKNQPKPRVSEIEVIKHQDVFVKNQPTPTLKVLSRKESAMLVSRSDIIIHSWRKLDVLGRGSFGTVYEGLSEDGIYFAVKEVCVSLVDNKTQQCVEQLGQEIKFLSKFRHENIVRYLGSEKDSDKLYIFLELATKGSLASLIRKYKLYDPQIRLYTRQILNGLKYLHDQRIVHRDIKCANILVDIDGKVKVADFGLARQVTRLNELKSCKGSAFWMAPEVIHPTKTYSFPADIWSLGCTVLEMETCRPPFGDLEWHRALWKLAHGELPPIPDDLPEDAKDFIRSCLQVDPSKRPVADQLLQHPFIRNVKFTPRSSVL